MSGHAKLNNELARPIGIVDGTRQGYNGKRPRTTCIALTDCVVTSADGTTRIIARTARKGTTGRAKARTTIIVGGHVERLLADRALMATMGSNHAGDV